jgi:stage II sporulation protein P
MNYGWVKKRKDKIKYLFVKFIKIAILLLVFWCSILINGKLLDKICNNYIKLVDTGVFKSTLNFSWPLIDVVYNSGNISVSFSNEIKSAIQGIFSFDFAKPLSILNVHTPLLYVYYNKVYLPNLTLSESDQSYKIDYSFLWDGSSDGKSAGDGLASSIYMDGELEIKNIPDENAVANGEIKIINETKYKINVESLLKEPLKLNFDKKGPKLLIYHTHTTESYILNPADIGKSNIPSNNEDPKYNVVRVGEELSQIMKKNYNIDTVHNGTIHDLPVYNNSYNNAYVTVTSILKGYPSIAVVFDIHRDAIEGNKKLRLTTRIDGKEVAQIAFVVATGEIGLEHPNWRENLKLALKIQEILNSKYPGLMRPIYISKYRYNQHVNNGALIIEVGGNGNTLDEAVESMKYFAEAVNEVINNNR